jgi:hypothetical protein
LRCKRAAVGVQSTEISSDLGRKGRKAGIDTVPGRFHSTSFLKTVEEELAFLSQKRLDGGQIAGEFAARQLDSLVREVHIVPSAATE